MPNLAVSEPQVPRTPKNKVPSQPFSLRITPEIEELLEKIRKKFPEEAEVSKHGIALAALRYGLLAIEKDSQILAEMEVGATKAKWANVLPLTPKDNK